MDDNKRLKIPNPMETLNNFPDFCESSLNNQDKITNKSSFKRELQYIDVSNILSTKRPRTEMKYSSQFLRWAYSTWSYKNILMSVKIKESINLHLLFRSKSNIHVSEVFEFDD